MLWVMFVTQVTSEVKFLSLENLF